jgi:hypothetical protein
MLCSPLEQDVIDIILVPLQHDMPVKVVTEPHDAVLVLLNLLEP